MICGHVPKDIIIYVNSLLDFKNHVSCTIAVISNAFFIAPSELQRLSFIGAWSWLNFK